MGKVGLDIVITHQASNKCYQEGIVLPNPNSNNEAKYVALIRGLETYLDIGITCLCVYVDTMLIIKKIRGS